MCLGRYSLIPCDTETVRHLRLVHGKALSSCNNSNMTAVAAEASPLLIFSLLMSRPSIHTYSTRVLQIEYESA